MKIVPLIPKTDTVENVAEQRKELKFLGTLRPKPGQKIWEVHLKNLTIEEAKVERPSETPFPLSKHTPPATLKGKIIMKPDCVYYAGINKKSAAKQHIKAVKAFQAKLEKLKKL